MLNKFMKLVSYCLFIFFLLGCVPHSPPSLRQTSELEQGKRFFNAGYYRPAMQILLPLAVDGIPQAQYAVGYMYYYGYGVTQDIDTGTFWIKRAADQYFQPAIKALELMSKQNKNAVKITKTTLL